jgi:NTE family protein
MRRVDWLLAEPFTLLLGAGFFGFFAHAGLLAALEEVGVVPARVVGASAGALAGGLWSAGVDAAELEQLLGRLRRRDFWDPGLPLGGLLRGQKLGRLLEDQLLPRGISLLEQCRIPFTAVVHDVWSGRPVPLRTGSLALAIRASCAVPLLFRPVRLHGRLFVDGGLSDRAGFSGVGPGERTLYHHLPHESPWSGLAGPEARELAAAPGRMTLVARGLPRVTPFRLEYGPVALVRARAAARAWLGQPIGTVLGG